MNVQEPGPRTNVVDPSQSPFADHNEPVPENDKGPLSQLQELTNVFSSTNTCNRNADNDIKVSRHADCRGRAMGRSFGF